MNGLRRGLGGAFLLATLTAGPAFATPVQVFTTWARGDMGTAHNSTTTAISCSVTGNSGPLMLYCQANDGVSFAFCQSTNVNMINALQTVTSVSQLEFGWDASRICTFLLVSTDSSAPGRRS